ncbi:unnamed protein product [Echinostoma caproni]|uniref:Uncharacterized protein n=1 Tax=Echinostoma caproni TaxID=27848 RepID=A0A183AR79_9TREM|nr:unnamed protein product [Echinostoma caproni]
MVLVSKNPNPPSSALIDDNEYSISVENDIEICEQEPVSLTKLPTTYSPRMHRKAHVTNVTDTKNRLSPSSIQTPQSNEGPKQMKYQGTINPNAIIEQNSQPNEKSHAFRLPSSGDQIYQDHVRHGHPSTETNNPTRRRCKLNEQCSRHHGTRADRHGATKSTVSTLNKMISRLDSRMAALAKHIPQTADCPDHTQLESTKIDPDDSRQFQELIANLTEAEWQALLHMISQTDDSYQSPRSRNKSNHPRGSTVIGRKKNESDSWSRERVRTGMAMERGDGRRGASIRVLMVLLVYSRSSLGLPETHGSIDKVCLLARVS